MNQLPATRFRPVTTRFLRCSLPVAHIERHLQQLDKRTAIRQFRGRFTNWTTTYIAPSYLVELARVTDNSDLLNKALRAKTDRANIVEAAKFINASQD